MKVVKGQAVQQGETIGIEGMTGRATGIHVHFYVMYQGKVIDPTFVLTK